MFVLDISYSSTLVEKIPQRVIEKFRRVILIGGRDLFFTTQSKNQLELTIFTNETGSILELSH